MPNCQYGKAESTQSIWGPCGGCYMPTGLGCPYLAASALPAASQSGSLQGTVVVTFGCIGLFVASLACGRMRLRRGPAAGFFGVYILYVVYVATTYT